MTLFEFFSTSTWARIISSYIFISFLLGGLINMTYNLWFMAEEDIFIHSLSFLSSSFYSCIKIRS